MTELEFNIEMSKRMDTLANKLEEVKNKVKDYKKDKCKIYSVETKIQVLERYISHYKSLATMEIEKYEKPFFEKVTRVAEVAFDLPTRKTKASAGYDFSLIEDVTIAPKQTVLIPTGVKAYMPENMVLLLFIRSSLGIKKQLRLALGTAVIDADYYNNPDNDGEMYFPITNDGELPVTLSKGERIGQGVFVNFNQVFLDNAEGKRTGGFGSTGK